MAMAAVVQHWQAQACGISGVEQSLEARRGRRRRQPGKTRNCCSGLPDGASHRLPVGGRGPEPRACGGIAAVLNVQNASPSAPTPSSRRLDKGTSAIFRPLVRTRSDTFRCQSVVSPASVPPAPSMTAEEARTNSAADAKPPATYVVLSPASMFDQVPVQRIAVWLAVALAVYELRDFLGIFMGTFVLSVAGNSMIAWFQQILPPGIAERRRILVASMYILTVLAVVGLGFVYLPGLTQEVAAIIYKVQRNEDPYRIISDRLRHFFGDKVAEQLEQFLLIAVSRANTTVLDMTIAGSREQRSQALQEVLKRYSGEMLTRFASIVASTSKFAIQSGVSLIFSFMVVWDFSTIQKGMQSLRHSRLGPAYQEIAPAVATFSRIFGKAMQAQSAIAVANTGLTALGMLVLNIPAVGPLSLIVFLCSFVPVAGVILSTIPIGLVGISDGGFMKLGLVILMVVLIHAIEAYILNPAIYSVHLKLHPIMALGVIVFAEHALGVWGLLVAVPGAVFFIEHLVMRSPISIEDQSAAMAA